MWTDQRIRQALTNPVAIGRYAPGQRLPAPFLHGTASKRPAASIAAFRNRAGAAVASSRGAIPSDAIEAPTTAEDTRPNVGASAR
jgi:hypothetical protein